VQTTRHGAAESDSALKGKKALDFTWRGVEAVLLLQKKNSSEGGGRRVGSGCWDSEKERGRIAQVHLLSERLGEKLLATGELNGSETAWEEA